MINWWGTGWPMVACPFLAPAVLYRMLNISAIFNMINIWATVCPPPYDVYVHGLSFWKTDWASYFLYIIFTYYTHDNQQECSRLSKSFSLWCLGPWKNHLAPVWWSNFRPMFLNDSWCVSLLLWRGIFYLCFAFTIVFIHYPSFTYYLSSHVILLWNSFLYQVLCIVIFQWLSLYSYLT